MAWPSFQTPWQALTAGIATGDAFYRRESHSAYDLFCANSSDFPTFAAFG